MTNRSALLALLAATLLAIPAAVPLAWLLLGSFGLDLAEPAGAPGVRAYRELFTAQPIGRWLTNSIWVASVQTLLAVFLCGMAGFALAAYQFRGRGLVVAVLVTMMLLPGPVAVTGLFRLIAALDGLDTFWAVILPGAASVFGAFLYGASFRALPRSRLEAARLDGCNELRLWWSIAMPAVRPTTTAFMLLHFLSAWNALLWPAAILVTEPKQTLPVALANLAGRVEYEADPSLLMAAVVVAVAPVMALFLIGARGLITGQRTTG